MKKNSLLFGACWLSLITAFSPAYSMGLRSFVALPVEEGGAVVRFSYERIPDIDISIASVSTAYGVNAKQTVLVGVPYRMSRKGADEVGDASFLYRHITWQQDGFASTKRFAFLGGAIVPTDSDRESAVQGGFVYSYFKNRHEIDVDGLYQVGMGDRNDSGRYDVSWQYRLSPKERPEWGLPAELNTVLELNGRWTEGSRMSHQVTAGLQWIHQQLVLEGGIVRDLNNVRRWHYLLSVRFHL